MGQVYRTKLGVVGKSHLTLFNLRTLLFNRNVCSHLYSSSM